MGRSYTVKGVRPPRYWQPKAGDVVYIEGKRTTLGTPTDDMFPLRPAIDGTTAMSEGCLVANVRIPDTK